MASETFPKYYKKHPVLDHYFKIFEDGTYIEIRCMVTELGMSFSYMHLKNGIPDRLKGDTLPLVELDPSTEQEFNEVLDKIKNTINGK